METRSVNSDSEEKSELILFHQDRRQDRLRKRRERYQKRKEDPEYQRTLKEKSEKRRLDPEVGRENLDYSQQRAKDPEFQMRRKEYLRQRRLDPSYREKVNQNKRDYYHKNKTNPEFLEKKNKLATAYCQRRSERKASDADYRKACRIKERMHEEKTSHKRRKTLSMSYVLKCIGGARRRSRKKSKTNIHFGFDLDTEHARQELLRRLMVGKCEVTGIPWDLNSDPWRATLDRIDNSRGYTLDNVRWVVWIYNRAKGKGSDDEVVKMALALARLPEPLSPKLDIPPEQITPFIGPRSDIGG
jgi:hypothetical protein